MEVTVNTPSTVKNEINVVLNAEDLQPHFDLAYTKAAKTIEVAGFRKGKAPLSMIKRMYGEEIEYRELDTIANFFYQQIVQEKKLHPIGEPLLTDIKYHRGNSLSYVVNVEVLPEFFLHELTGVQVQKIIHKVTDEEVTNEIEYLRRTNATYADVQQATDEEHIVTFEIQELDEHGLPIVGNKTEPIQVHLGDESKLAEIREGLKHSEVGKHYHITYTPQQGERQEPIDGKFDVLRIQKVTLPELNEEFIKKITKNKFSSIEEFRTSIRNDLETYWKDRSIRNVEDAIAAELVHRHPFEVPDSLVKGFTDGLLEEIKEKQPGKTLPTNFDEQKFREENQGYSVWQAKWFLLREKIREHLQLKIEDADFEKIAEEESKKIGIERERLVAYYKNSKSLNEKILNDKMFAYLVSHAVLTEKRDTEFDESPIMTP